MEVDIDRVSICEFWICLGVYEVVIVNCYYLKWFLCIWIEIRKGMYCKRDCVIFWKSYVKFNWVWLNFFLYDYEKVEIVDDYRLFWLILFVW